MEKEACLQDILHISQKPHRSGSPLKEPPPPQGPLHGIPRREMPHHYNPPSFIYQSPRCMCPPSHIPGSSRMERGSHGERCPYLETFLAYLPGSLIKEFPPVFFA
jgi:hypothetical protein